MKSAESRVESRVRPKDHQRITILVVTVGLALVAGSIPHPVLAGPVFGYVNSDYPSGYLLIANPLSAPDNRLPEIMPQAPEGTRIIKLENQTWFTNEVRNGSWTSSEMTLVPGEAAILHSPLGWTFTAVGDLRQQPFEVNVRTGGCLLSCPIPREGHLSTDFQFPQVVGTRVHGVEKATGTFTLRATCTDTGWDPEDPVLGIGLGIYVEAPVGFTWKYVFNLPIGIEPDDSGNGIVVTPPQLLGWEPTIEVSSDLIEWTQLHGQPVGDDSVLDPSMSRHSRFYRVRLD